MPSASPGRSSPLPGFGLSLGITILWLSLIVLIPLVGGVREERQRGMARPSGRAAVSPRALAATGCRSARRRSRRRSIASSACSSPGCWCATAFAGRRLLSALIDLPFALPTAVAGIALTALYADTGIIGRFLEPAGFPIAYRPAGVVVALTFIGLPFVVRTVEPVLADGFERDRGSRADAGRDAAADILRVILPAIAPALATGFALAFARGAGEYGSVIFIAGNMPFKSEIAPLLIVTQLEEYNYAGAAAIACVMLLISFALLLLLNLLQHWQQRRVA